MSTGIDIQKHNAVIAKANARIEELRRGGYHVTAREGAQGVTIDKRRIGVPSGRGYEGTTRSEIIPWNE